MSNDSIRKNRLCFIYDICPKWYNITSDEFMSYPDYKYPLYQEETSIPYRTPSFYEKFGVKISCDTAKFVGTRCLAVLKKPNAPHFFFTNIAVKGRSVKADSRFAKKELEGFYSWLTNSYEYINYKVNHEREVDFNIDSIRGKQFSFIEDSCKKESLQFINDSVCLHSLSFKTDMFSTYESSILDTCHYAFTNNLIGVNLIKGNSCDTLTYSNGILFYSKVYKDGNNEGYKHIVKPFIDETRSCANKIDSINMIMSTYFNVYVPLNFYK